MNTFQESIIEKALLLIKEAEGFRSDVYLDSLGYQTIGYGHKLRPHQIGKVTHITQKKAEQLMFLQLQQAQKEVKNYWGNSLNAINHARIAVLLDMVYNCGKIRWPKLTKAVQDQNWQQAAAQILDSKYRHQVGVRAFRNAEIMRKGVMRSNKDFMQSGDVWILKDNS